MIFLLLFLFQYPVLDQATGRLNHHLACERLALELLKDRSNQDHASMAEWERLCNTDPVIDICEDAQDVIAEDNLDFKLHCTGGK